MAEVGKPGPIVCDTSTTNCDLTESAAGVASEVASSDAGTQPTSRWAEYISQIPLLGPSLLAAGQAAKSARAIFRDLNSSGDHLAGKAKLFSPGDIRKLRESMAKHLEPIDVGEQVRMLKNLDPNSNLPGGGRAAWIEYQVAPSPRGEVAMDNALEANFDAKQLYELQKYIFETFPGGMPEDVEQVRRTIDENKPHLLALFDKTREADKARLQNK